MPWRTLALGDDAYAVSLAAERGPRTESWQLVVAFRALSGDRGTVWVPLPYSSANRGALFAQAEGLSDEALASVLAERLG